MGIHAGMISMVMDTDESFAEWKSIAESAYF